MKEPYYSAGSIVFRSSNFFANISSFGCGIGRVLRPRLVLLFKDIRVRVSDKEPIERECA